MSSPGALVTGASRGIGRAICLALAERGFDIVVTARTRYEGDGLARSSSLRAPKEVSVATKAHPFACLRDRGAPVLVHDPIRRWLAPILASAAAAAGLVIAATASAHPLAPALLQITEQSDGTADVVWKVPSMRVRGSRVEPDLPSTCRPLGVATSTEGEDSVTFRWRVACDPGGLAGGTVAVRGLETSRTDALVRITLADGRLVRAVLRASAPELNIPLSERPASVFFGYLRLGFDHILQGIDHLLFVFGLVLLATSTRLLIEIITAFTVGHSVTLTLAAFELWELPQAPVEVLIALSIFVLALELTRGPHAPPTLLRRFPWGIAFLFGLLHGLGFAGALREIGLPQHDLPLALFSFNVGIELGQLVFVAAVLAAGLLLGRLLARRPAWSEWVPIYAMGCLSAYWVIDRFHQALR